MSAWLEAFVGSGQVAELALGLIVVEFFALLLWRGGRGWRARAVGLALALGPGACLLLALRAALVGEGWVWVCVWLSAALPLHIMDVWRRRISA